MEKRVLKVHRINPHCGCSDKAFYTLFRVIGLREDVMGSDEFPYKDDTEFQRKIDELKLRFNAQVEIQPRE